MKAIVAMLERAEENRKKDLMKMDEASESVEKVRAELTTIIDKELENIRRKGKNEVGKLNKGINVTKRHMLVWWRNRE